MYRNLENEMRAKNITIDDIAEAIKTSAGEAQKKVNGEETMLFKEGLIIWQRFFSYRTFEYLFENDG